MRDPAPGRIEAIRRTYEREDARPLVELLVDLEADRLVALDVLKALHRAEMPAECST